MIRAWGPAPEPAPVPTRSLLPGPDSAWVVLDATVGLIMTALVFALIFKVLPDASRPLARAVARSCHESDRMKAMTSAASSGVMRNRGIGGRNCRPSRAIAPSVSKRRACSSL